MPENPDRKPRAGESAAAWYRQPVLWLGALIFVGSMAGCVWLIVQGARHPDVPLDAPHAVFDVPTSARSSHGTSP